MHKNLIFALALVAACGTPPHGAPMPENAVWSDPAFEAAAQELSEADKLMLIHYAARYDEARSTTSPLWLPATIGDAITEQRAYEKAQAESAAKAAEEKKAIEALLKTAVRTRLVNKQLMDKAYPKRVALTLEFTNNLDVEIQGVMGRVVILDMFDKELMSASLSYDKPLLPNAPVEWVAAMPYNQFTPEDVAFAAADSSKLTSRFHPEIVLLADGTRLEVAK